KLTTNERRREIMSTVQDTLRTETLKFADQVEVADSRTVGSAKLRGIFNQVFNSLRVMAYWEPTVEKAEFWCDAFEGFVEEEQEVMAPQVAETVRLIIDCMRLTVEQARRLEVDYLNELFALDAGN